MIYAGFIGIRVFPQHTFLFLMGILSNFVVWLKVSTDMYPLLGLFAAASFLHMELEYIKEKEAEMAEQTEKAEALKKR